MARQHVTRTVVTVAAGLVLAGCGGGAASAPAADPAGSTASAPPGDHAAESRPEPMRTAVPNDARVARPTAVALPALDIRSTLDRLRVDGDGALQSPPRWQVAGWFVQGPRPGERGPAVVAGHVDSPDGPAVFARLSEVAVGDTVVVTRADGSTATFRVDRTELVPQDAFPTEDVYGPTPDAQLRLITCDGPYVESQGGYQDNLVVYATEVVP